MHTAILVEPEIPENTGFIARLAANFDFFLSELSTLISTLKRLAKQLKMLRESLGM